jgi:hypothetical protein
VDVPFFELSPASVTSFLQSNLYYYQRSVGNTVLVSGTHLGPITRFLLLSDTCGFAVVEPLTRERASLWFITAADHIVELGPEHVHAGDC